MPLLVKMSNDKIPNIRFNVAKVIGSLIPLVSAQSNGQLRPCLTQLVSDQDVDVQFYSTKALEILAI